MARMDFPHPPAHPIRWLCRSRVPERPGVCRVYAQLAADAKELAYGKLGTWDVDVSPDFAEHESPTN